MIEEMVRVLTILDKPRPINRKENNDQICQ